MVVAVGRVVTARALSTDMRRLCFCLALASATLRNGSSLADCGLRLGWLHFKILGDGLSASDDRLFAQG